MIFDENTGLLLVRWFEKNKRDMAWREDPTPYHVWISEIMLQQTRVDTVHAYYARFLKTFPTVGALARADEDLLLKQWEGLGYYRRVRNLQKAAQIVEEKYGGLLPDSYEALCKLPGIGSYTAGAILSIAFHKKYPVADGNVLRVLSRFLGRREDIRDPKTKKHFEEELFEFLSASRLDPSSFNQGLMELGALVCIPNGQPKCQECPWSKDCIAFCDGLLGELPVISPKQEKEVSEKTVFLIYKGDRIAVTKRKEGDLLEHLSGFPTVDGFCSSEEVKRFFGPGTELEMRSLPEKKHIFTHRIWRMRCYEIRIRDIGPEFSRIMNPEEIRFVTKSELDEQIALPTAFRKWPLFPVAEEDQ